MLGPFGRSARLALAVAVAAVGASAAARAHPHMFVEARTIIHYDGGKFVSLEHRWTFDEFYTATAIEGLDANKDGVYDRQELAELAKVNIEGLKEFAYFTFPKAAGKEIKFADVTDYHLEHKEGALTLVFKLPFEAAVPADAKDFHFSVADPTWFIAFDWAKSDAVRMSDGAPRTCQVRIGSESGQPKPADKTEEEALRGAFSQQFGNMVSEDRSVYATCPR
ncbi:MAG: DUF1007 family protein [Hyphomicrobiaceae bacterium]|nr:DUF1007 family protein [Hyphomicrobiaceae bacterium]